jgi:hypothetical protein
MCARAADKISSHITKIPKITDSNDWLNSLNSCLKCLTLLGWMILNAHISDQNKCCKSQKWGSNLHKIQNWDAWLKTVSKKIAKILIACPEAKRFDFIKGGRKPEGCHVTFGNRYTHWRQKTGGQKFEYYREEKTQGCHVTMRKLREDGSP